MIEEVPEDLPPTQRLETPSQRRQSQRSTVANPDCLSSDSEESTSPLVNRNTSARGNTREVPQEKRELGGRSNSPPKANIARLYGNPSDAFGKRAHTMA
jgi:hypothetical protein